MWLRLSILVIIVGSVAVAQTARVIDTGRSTITVEAYKTGLFSFAGHNHTISAPIASGTLDEGQRTIELTVNTKDLQVLDPGESDKDRHEIRETMLGDQLLDADKFPTITFHSSSVQPTSKTEFSVKGELSLHGTTRVISLNISRNGDQYAGSTTLKQTDFGMKPIAVAGGTIKVKDEVKVEFVVVPK